MHGLEERFNLNDDFCNLPEHTDPCGLRGSDTSVPVLELMESLEWLRCVDPTALQSLLNRGDSSPIRPEMHAVILLCDLLDFARLNVSGVSNLAVNWGDGSPVECFGPDRDPLNPDHAHYFSKSGQYRVLIAVTTGSAPASVLQLIVQVRNETGEVTVMRPAGLN
jgi:hypothetical protein